MCIPASTTAASLAASAASTSAASHRCRGGGGGVGCLVVVLAVWNCPLKIVPIFYLADCHCVVVSVYVVSSAFLVPHFKIQRSPSNPLEGCLENLILA